MSWIIPKVTIATTILSPTRHPAFRVSRPKWRTRLTSGTSSRFGNPKSEGCSKHTGKTRWTKMTRSKQTKLTWLNFEGVWRGVCPSQILGETRCLQHVDVTKKNKLNKKSSVWGGHPLFSPPSKLRQGTSQYQRKSSSKPSFWRTLAVSFQEGSPVSKKWSSAYLSQTIHGIGIFTYTYHTNKTLMWVNILVLWVRWVFWDMPLFLADHPNLKARHIHATEIGESRESSHEWSDLAIKNPL